MNALGRHILVEFLGCDPEVLNDVSLTERGMVGAAVDAGATVINSTFHHFSPYGVSGVVVIQESHLAIHTWPEYRYAAVDLFTCGDTVDPWVSFDYLKRVFRARSHTALEMWRGSLSMLDRVGYLEEVLRQVGQAVLPRFTRNLWFTDRDDVQALSLRYDGDVLFQERSLFQTVRVYDTLAYGKMMASGNTILTTERDEFHYHEMLVHPAMQSHNRPERVLIIGGGDGGAAREAFRYDSIRDVVLVEIDEAVVRASRQHLPQLACELDNIKLDLRIADGVRFLEEVEPESFDIILVDGSDPAGPSKGLFTREFYRNCYRALRPDGVVAAQGESPMFQARAFVGLHRCLKETFGSMAVHTLLFHAPTWPSGMWSVQLAFKGNRHPVRDLETVRTERFAETHGLRYYSAETHAAAFALPTFVKRMLEADAVP